MTDHLAYRYDNDGKREYGSLGSIELWTGMHDDAENPIYDGDEIEYRKYDRETDKFMKKRSRVRQAPSGLWVVDEAALFQVVNERKRYSHVRVVTENDEMAPNPGEGYET